jgi:hypothetical protein
MRHPWNLRGARALLSRRRAMLVALLLGALCATEQPSGHAAAPGWQVAPASNTAPQPRSQFGMAADAQGHIFVFGGNDYEGPSSNRLLGDFWQYDTATGDWHALVNDTVPSLIEPHLASDGQGNVWEFGGVTNPGPPHLSADGHSYGLYEYQPALGTWNDRTRANVSPGTNWPPGREDFGFAFDAVANALVVFAGEGQGDVGLNDLWTYSIQHGIWTEVTQRYSGSGGEPIAPREIYNVSADALGHLYLFGGAYLSPPYGAGDNAYANDLWRYDDATQTWTLLSGVANGYDPSIPVPRHYYGQTVDANGDFEILGGYVDAPESPPFFSQDRYTSYAVSIEFPDESIPGADGLTDFWRYDPAAGWQDERASLGVFADQPLIPYVMVTDQLDDRLYTFGGFHPGQGSTLAQSNSIWLLNEQILSTPTVTATATLTATSSVTASATQTVTPLASATATSSPTLSATGTATASSTPTSTISPSATVSASPTPQETSIAVVQGWNLISLPLGPLDSHAFLASLLAQSGGHHAALYALVGGAWSPPQIDNNGTFSGNPPFTLQVGTGYLLYSDQPAAYVMRGSVPDTLPTWQIAAGWNLVGFPAQNGSLPATQALLAALQARTNGSLDALYAMHGDTWSQGMIDNQGHITVISDPLTLQPGGGYLLYSDRAADGFAPGTTPQARSLPQLGMPSSSQSAATPPPLPSLPGSE